MTRVHGTVDASFGAVRDAFAENFDDGEVGASCQVIVDGHVVVDLWGGFADEARTRDWQRDTLVNAYSVGKPVIAVMLLQAVARGLVDLDAPASTYWPELVAGQRGATARHVLCHRAGVPAIREELTNDALWDWHEMCRAIAATEPWWVPGTAHAYHSNTYGHLVGELARRVTGRMPGEWLRDEIAGPLDAALFWGVPAADQARCADVVWEGDMQASIDWLRSNAHTEQQRMIALGYVNPPGYSSMGVVNTPEWRGAQVPSVNLHATARGIARFYAALAGGGPPVVDRDILTEATTTQSEGWCPVLERDVTFGLGFQLTRADRPLGPNPRAFGHYGTGGSLGFADPDANVAFGYTMNAVKPGWQGTRNRRLVDALYASL